MLRQQGTRGRFDRCLVSAFHSGGPISDVPEKPDPPRILVVDDEPLVRELVREVLVREGYAVLHAHTAEEALALVGPHGNDGVLDLLVTDLTMPGMDGVTLARTLRAAYPALVTLLMSGGPADHRLDCAGEPDGAGAAGRFFFLQKPFSIEGLRKAVRSALKSIRQRSAESRPGAAPDKSPARRERR